MSSPAKRAELAALSAASFDLAKRMQVGRRFLLEHGVTDQGYACSLAYHIRKSNKRAARAIRKNANLIINEGYKDAALRSITFETA